MDNGHALITAMLYGKLDGLSQETIFLFGRTGLLHLFSASGFHMGVAVMLARQASRLIGPALPSPGRKYGAFLLSLSLMTFFGSVTDWSSPMVRAYAFTTLLAGAALWQVRPSISWVFVLSLLCSSVLGNSSTLSFLLSAFGMAGVLVAGKGMLNLALGPWLFTLPLVIWHFGLFSLSSPLWNLSAGLVIGFTVLPLAILDLVLEAFGFPWRGLRDLAAFGMERIAIALHLGDSMIGLSYWVNAPLFLAVSSLIGAVYFWRRSRPQLNTPWIVTAALLAAPLLLPSVKLAVLDVGQGDAIYLLSEKGERVLVDAGPRGRKTFPAPVNRALEKLAIGPLNHLLLTHTDLDHLGGIPSLLARHRILDALWIREEALGDKRLLPTLEMAERAGIKISFVSGKSFPPSLRCWLPPKTTGNESSPFCFGTLRGDKTIWLTGDGGKLSEAWLLGQGKLPEADFLKVGHHGSKNSTGAAFLQASGATTALISAGKKNRYGHPAIEVMERLEEKGIKIRNTANEGSLVFY